MDPGATPRPRIGSKPAREKSQQLATQRARRVFRLTGLSWTFGSLYHFSPPLAPHLSLFTFHFSPILPDARLVELSQSIGSVAPGRRTRIIRGLFEAFRPLY
jgi:hypothetical protein